MVPMCPSIHEHHRVTIGVLLVFGDAEQLIRVLFPEATAAAAAALIDWAGRCW